MSDQEPGIAKVDLKHANAQDIIDILTLLDFKIDFDKMHEKFKIKY